MSLLRADDSCWRSESTWRRTSSKPRVAACSARSRGPRHQRVELHRRGRQALRARLSLERTGHAVGLLAELSERVHQELQLGAPGLQLERPRVRLARELFLQPAAAVDGHDERPGMLADLHLERTERGERGRGPLDLLARGQRTVERPLDHLAEAAEGPVQRGGGADQVGFFGRVAHRPLGPAQPRSGSRVQKSSRRLSGDGNNVRARSRAPRPPGGSPRGARRRTRAAGPRAGTVRATPGRAP